MSAGTMLVWGGVLGWVTEWLLVVTRDGCRADHSSPTLASITLAHMQDTVIIYNTSSYTDSWLHGSSKKYLEVL